MTDKSIRAIVVRFNAWRIEISFHHKTSSILPLSIMLSITKIGEMRINA
jgi:hypothetical protein